MDASSLKIVFIIIISFNLLQQISFNFFNIKRMISEPKFCSKKYVIMLVCEETAKDFLRDQSRIEKSRHFVYVCAGHM